ncbi:TetR/AcrR family transcriptional regulator [Bacillus sp. BRMEA1]|uniref:TetR/AcrR family transcriptional regulator n=1 Tax=Neobacillus endophyticus TaxID=2738405 RepID=UPI001563D3A9|nr:TetR/AcrR family transcriptional regulator [Neobacillus endophyticus]NRD79956.1 TetR/AcrR family transcriptional regulator [Neobacillus endophyticus]
MAKKQQGTINRRDEIISAAIEVFAQEGYYRTSTAKVAEKANISQPYIFKFFSSKELLLEAALKVSWNRIQTSFLQVIESASPRNLEENLIAAYTEIMKNNENEILLQMQAQTIREENIIKVMQEELMKVHSIVLNAFKTSGITNPSERTLLFLARGMLCNISLSLQLPQLMKTDD